MNAHNPFDAKKDWSNPYCQNSSNDPMVDALLGNAYHVVRTVYCNLGYIKHLYDFLSKYGVVICVQSEAELKTLTTEAKYARIYDKSPAGDRRVTDYLYVDDDRTGIIPDDTTATGSWVKVATSNSGNDSKDGGYIPWVYNSGSANGGETSIRIPDETAGAPFMIVNGDWQTEGYDFEYDPLTFEIKFTTPLEQGDFVVVMRTGVPATPDNPNISDWVTINWLYNHGAAVGGEQVIAIPYTFQSVPAVYKNGLRFSKGLANNSYTIDSDNNRIILTEPLATNDRLVIQLGGEAKVLETVDHTIQEVARVANVKDSEVILSTDTTQVLNGKKVVYSVSEQKAYGLPVLPTNVYIKSVAEGKLTYNPGSVSVDLLDAPSQLRDRLLAGPLEVRNGGLGLRNIVTVSDFGGKTGFNNDSSDALVAFINAINSGDHEGSEFLIDGLYRTTKPLPSITKPVTLKGVIQANSAILFDDVLDGIKLDHSSLTDATVHSYVGYFSVLTNKTIAGTGFKYIPNSSGRDASVKLEINSFRVDSLSRFTGSTSSSEWLTGIHIGEASFGFKPSEVRIYNTVVYGSDSNQNYSTLTGTGSSGIIVEKSTNCIIKDAKVFLLDGYGILFRGQSEGCGVYHSQAVAVRKGIFFTGPVNPSNNHFISTTHIAPYETGIFVEPPAATPNVSTPMACYFSDIFILERGDSVAKSTRFIGLDVATRLSKMTNITVWANAKTGGIHEKIGFRVACAGNTLVNCHSHNMTYSLETFEVIPGYAYGVELCGFFDEKSITGFISPLSFKNPTGSVRTSTKPYDRPLYYADQMTVIHNSGVPIFDVNAGTVSNRSPTGNVTNYSHIPHNQTVPGAQLAGLGGTDTPNSGNWNILSALALFSGDIRPSTPNTKNVGTPGAPWAGGNTQTAFNVTSDERYKTPPKSITDTMLDAWAEVEWVQYQYLDRVEAKGIDGARWHYGVIAQRTMEAFSRHGLDASKYGFLCHDEWEAIDEVVDDESGHIITPALAAGDRYGIRYEEALALEAALQRRNYERLLKRIEALESK